MKSFLLLSSLLTFSSVASGQVNFNNITYSGTGCPKGTVSTVVTPDGTMLSVLFDDFRTEVPQYDGNNDNGELPRNSRSRTRNTPTVSHKNCSLSFTASLPPGMKADALEIGLQARGATILDEGVEGYFASILVGYHGLARSRGNPTVIATKHWKNRRTGAVDDNWVESAKPLIQLQSACSGTQGKDIRFDLKNHINAEIVNGDVNKRGMIVVDSQDMSGFLTFTLRTRPCAGGSLSP